MKNKLLLLIVLAVSAFADAALIPTISEDRLNYRITESFDKLVFSSRLNLIKMNGYNVSIIYWNITPYTNNEFKKQQEKWYLYIGYKY